ncbi:MAG TPA: ORF6N domain-containing protein, partial [Opitutaceae bacterium]
MILDADLARLYGVTTKRFNESVKRNVDRFPADFAFQISEAEFAEIRSQIATSSSVDLEAVWANWSQFATSSKANRRGKSYTPWAFTEHGAVMAANVLRSAKAVEMSVYVVRAFVRMREELMTNSEILKRLAHIDKSLIEHDTA